MDNQVKGKGNVGNWISVVVLLLIVVGFGGYAIYANHPHTKVKAAVRAVLTDPDSAQFRNFATCIGGFWICGEVNARNKMGGYTGFKPFRVQRTTYEVVLE